MALPLASALLPPFRTALGSPRHLLRIGVVVDQGRSVPWADHFVSAFESVPATEIRLLSVHGPAVTSATPPGWLIERLHSISRSKFDAFGTIQTSRPLALAPESLQAIQSAGCHVLVWLSAVTDTRMDVSALARYGMLSLRFGTRDEPVPFWSEVVSNAVTSRVSLYWHESSLLRRRCIGIAEPRIAAGLFFTGAAIPAVVAAIRMLANSCLDLRDDPVRFLEKVQAMPEAEVATAQTTPSDPPPNIATGQFIARKLLQSVRGRWKARGRQPRWMIALRPNTGSSIVSGGADHGDGFINVVMPPGIEEIADPFLWETEEKTYLFFEDMPPATGRGRLGYGEIAANGLCSEVEFILESASHVSYPCLIPVGADLFMMPESAEAGTVNLYRLAERSFRPELVATLVDGVQLVDTTPILIDGRWYFFTSTVEPFNETLLFWSDRLDGSWNLHPSSPVSCSIKNSRSAGNLFWRNGRLYRPTQDCSVRYGYAMQINEVIRLTPTEFAERTVNHVLPVWRKGLLGNHTWNESARYQVIDGLLPA